MKLSMCSHRKYLVLCCILQTAYGIISMCFAVVLNMVADAASGGGTAALFRVSAAGILFGIAYPAGRALADSTTLAYGEREGQSLRSRITRAILSMNAREFSREDTGAYINSLTGDVALITEQYYTKIPVLFCCAAQFVFCVIYCFMLNPIVCMVLMVMSALQYLVPVLSGGRIRQLTAAQSKKTASFTSKAKELLLGFSVIKSYGAEDLIQSEFEDSGRDMEKARKKAAVATRIMICTNMLAALMLVLVSVLVAAYFVSIGAMKPATLLTVLYIANRFSMPVTDFSRAYTQIRGSGGVRKKVSDFLSMHPQREEKKKESRIKSLEVCNLNFSYDQNTPALTDISYSFAMGKKYLLTGESGCGKSTLLKILAGQYPSRGVYLDGIPLEDLTESDAAGRIILVGQQPYVFRRSVADNIDFLKTGDRKRLEKAVDLCCLYDFVSGLPEGIDTVVDEEQRQLSGGQKARIGLARAIYAEPDILLLDEVTSALDPGTAREIENMLLNLPDVMIIHISHKPVPEFMKRYDAVLTMESGRLVSEGQRLERKAGASIPESGTDAPDIHSPQNRPMPS